MKFVKKKKQLSTVEMIKSIYVMLATLIFMKTTKNINSTYFDSIQELVFSKNHEISDFVMSIPIE